MDFEKIRSHSLPSLQAGLEEYLHPASGARHIHLATSQGDLAFLLAFPTLPENDSGSPHILEHLALAGSKRYPVRAPFFSMLRRTVSHCMNAMTCPDRTVYLFASTDRTDFFNLLDVYLDAAFFPNLDYLDFLQEGWRYTLVDGNLAYQGVVLNEMKGLLADPSLALYTGITRALLAGTPYAMLSGGDPLAIPTLTHQMLRDFHARHYHPSQAVFMTAGPIPAAEVQRRIGERVLSELPGTAARLQAHTACVTAPRTATIDVPAPRAGADGWGVQIAWILGEAADTDVHYHARLLEAGLLGDPGAPLRKAMESSGFGRPARLNGMDSAPRQMLFHAGMEGLGADQVPAARRLIWDALADAQVQGVPTATLQAALREITYRQRDTSGARGMPNVLTRMLNALPAAMHGGDVLAAFDSESVLQRLRRDITDPGFFKRLVRRLIDNPARLDATVRPLPAFITQRAAVERGRLAAALSSLDAAGRDRIVADNAALAHRQRERDAGDALPRIVPQDVSPHPRPVMPFSARAHGRYLFDIPSNGVSYATAQYDLSALPEQEWPWLALYAHLRQDLGSADMDYQAAGAWRQRMVPALGIAAESLVDASKRLHILLNVSASALREDHAGIASVLDACIAHPRFDELPRIAFLVERLARRVFGELSQDGDRYAALCATAPLSAQRHFENLTAGTGMLPFLAGIRRLAATPDGARGIAAHLAALHARILDCPVRLLCAGGAGAAEALSAELPVPGTAAHSAWPASAGRPPHRHLGPRTANAALHAPGQVNHCHIAWAVPMLGDRHAPALAVAAELLAHQFLHPALREQGGAYAGRASYASDLGVFTMSSFRDPRLEATYADFETAIGQVLATDFRAEQIEEAIICAIKTLDRPASPYESVRQAWHLHLRGVDQAMRQQHRTGVLRCTQADIREAVDTWLKKAVASRAAFVGDPDQALAGLEMLSLQALTEEPVATA